MFLWQIASIWVQYSAALSKTHQCLLLQTNADASLMSGNIGADTLRQSILGYNQGRNLLDYSTKTNADASLLSGNIGTNTLRQSILGYNQGKN